jgi:signal transduction histidine kinase
VEVMSAVRSRRASAREVDDAAARLVARARVVVLTVAAVAAAVAFGEASHPGFQYTLTFAGLPGAVALALATDKLRPTVSAGVGAVVDLVVFAAALEALPKASATLTAGFAIAVLVASYTGGRLLGALTGFAGIAALVVLDGLDRIPATGNLLVLLVIAIGVSLAVVARTDARLLRSAGRARNLETRAALLLEHLAEPIVVTGEGGRIVQYNDAAQELLELPRVGPRTCTAALALAVDGQVLDCSATCGLLAIAGSQESGGVEATAGNGVPLLVSVAELPGEDGKTVEHLHTVRDITKLKLADEAKTLFLATATHELKTPLTVIRGFLETIANPEMEDELRETAITVMRRRADELASIIDRILLASRIESGHLEVDVQPLDPVEVTRERVAALAAATGRTIAFHAPRQVPEVLAHGPTLATVLDHLLDNAGKYSPGTAPIEVEVRVRDDAVVELSVRDHGVGMTPDEMAHCFDRFWQADPTSRRKVGGTGIGLYIVRSLVQSMRGTIDVSSAPGRGATFTVGLGRADAAVAAAAGVESPAGATFDGPGGAAREPSIVREVMRQIGVDTTREPAP